VYFRSQLFGMLHDEYGCDPPEMVNEAIDGFLKDVTTGDYEASVIMADDDEPLVEGDLDVDAEHVYNTQRYWDLPEAPVDAVGLEDVELPPNDYDLRDEEGL
jgi:hypothetical protein